MRGSLAVVGLISVLVTINPGCTQAGARGRSQQTSDAAATKLALVVDGQPTATIVIRRHPTAELEFAATTLQEYIRRMSGAVLPIATDGDRVTDNRILLGLSNACRGAGLRWPSSLADDAYLICRTGRDLVIVGGSDRGTVNGVCGLLDDHLGVRWYVPDDDLGTVVPQRDTIVIDEINEVREPSFPMRWVGRGSDWAIYNRQSCNGRTLDANFAIEPGIFHTQGALLRYEDYFPEHPEYFALIQGRRSSNRGCKLCYSNPETAQAVAAAMAALLDEDPEIDLISFSPTDGQKWCECDECRALDERGVAKDQRMSRRSLIFYNALAAALRPTHPEANLLVGAYNVYNRPPADRTLKADPMLSVIVTHYEDYCMAHPIADPTCWRNRRYVRLLRAWDRLGTRVCYYEYYWKVNWMDLPWPIVHCIARDIPWFHRRGDRGVYTQFVTTNAWTLYPNYYIAARLLWDVNTDVDALFDRMCNELFGTAGPAVREYYRVMERSMARTDEHFPGHGIKYGPLVFTDEVLEEMGRHLREARRRADSDLVRKRLAKLELSYEYTTRLMNYAALRASNDPDDARHALTLLEELVAEVRTDRDRWGGVVSPNVVADRRFLGLELERMRERVQTMR